MQARRVSSNLDCSSGDIIRISRSPHFERSAEVPGRISFPGVQSPAITSHGAHVCNLGHVIMSQLSEQELHMVSVLFLSAGIIW